MKYIIHLSVFIILLFTSSCNSNNKFTVENDVVLSPVENIAFIFDRFLLDQSSNIRVDEKLLVWLEVDTAMITSTFYQEVFKKAIDNSHGNYIILKDKVLFQKFIAAKYQELIFDPNLLLCYGIVGEETFVFLRDQSKELSLTYVASNFTADSSRVKGQVTNKEYLEEYKVAQLAQPLFIFKQNQLISTAEKINISANEISFQLPDFK